MDINTKTKSVSSVSECKSSDLHLTLSNIEGYLTCKIVSHIYKTGNILNNILLICRIDNIYKNIYGFCKTYTYKWLNMLINNSLRCKINVILAYNADNQTLKAKIGENKYDRLF